MRLSNRLLLASLCVVATSGCEHGWLGEVSVPVGGGGVPADEPTVHLGHAGVEAINDEIMVRLSADAVVNARFLRAIEGVRVEEEIQTGYVRVRLVGAVDIAQALQIAAQDPAVAESVPNAVVHGAARRDAMNGPWGTLLWQTTGLEEPDEAPLDWTSAWAMQPRADGIIVAVLDSGVAYADREDQSGTYRAVPDLACTPILPGRDHINYDEFAGDDNQHGTHIAALIAADPACGAQTQGYAPGVTILPIKVLDADLRGSELALVKGIHEAVDAGAQIINMSLALGAGYYPSPFLEEALQRAHDADVLMFAAAGNNGDAAVAWPAASPLVVAVGAHRVDDDGDVSRTDYSQRGAALDILAAGGAMHLDENQDGLPDGVVAQTIAAKDPSRFGYFMGAGTSQATAAASGLAALMLAAGAAPQDVPRMLRESARLEFDANAGSGPILPSQAILAVANGALAPAPEWSVELIGALEQKRDPNRFEGCAHVRVVDQNMQPVRDVTVHGTWHGPTLERDECVTDGDGVCRIKTRQFDGALEAGVSVALDLQALVGPDGTIVRPRGFFQMPRVQATAVAEWSEEQALEGKAGGTVARAIDRSDPAIALLDCGDLIPRSYMIQNMGRARATNPTLFLMSDVAMQGIDPSFEADDETQVQGNDWGDNTYVARFNPAWGTEFGTPAGLSSRAWVVNAKRRLWSPRADDEFWGVWGSGLWGLGMRTMRLSPSPGASHYYGFGVALEPSAGGLFGAGDPSVGTVEIQP